jgi:hypothetical protein
MRMIALTMACAGLSTGAVAQDLYTSPLDHTPVMALGAAANAQARQVAGKSRGSRRASAAVSDRQTCREVPSYRAKLGASDPRIIKLTRLCREAGL